MLVRPNYRKLPESTGREILEGLARFWTWFRGGLGAAVEAATAGAVEADEARTLLIGHSAGMSGFLAVAFSMMMMMMIHWGWSFAATDLNDCRSIPGSAIRHHSTRRDF